MPLLWKLIIPLNSRGITVDKERRNALRKERAEKLASWRKRAERHFKGLGVPLPLGIKGGFSPKKVQELLYETLGLPTQFNPKDLTKKTADRKALRRVQRVDETGTVDLLLEFSEMKDAAVPLMSRESPDGRMRTRYVFGGDEKHSDNQAGTESPASGRLASRQVTKSPPLGTNLQNWTEWVRCVLVAKKGWGLVKADYSQIELRLTAHYSRDRNLLRAFESGDVYIYILWMLDRDTGIFDLATRHSVRDLQELYRGGDEVVGFARQDTKRLALGWTYRMGARKMENVKGIPYKRGKIALEGLGRTFPGVVRWWGELEETVRERSMGSGWGWLENPWGRKRYFFVNDDVPAICNFFPQSTAAEILFDAMEAIEERTTSEPTKLILTLHDEVVLESPEAKTWATIVKRLMERPITPLGNLVVPVEVSVGRNWAKAKKGNPDGVAPFRA